MIQMTKRHSYRVLTDKSYTLKKNTKKKWNNVHLQNYVAIPTILDQFSGHFSGHFLV